MAPFLLIGADGVVCSTSRSHLIDSREALLMNSVRYASIYKEASRHLLDGRSHPSLTKEGSSPDADGVKCARVSLRKEGKTHTHNSFTRSERRVRVVLNSAPTGERSRGVFLIPLQFHHLFPGIDPTLKRPHPGNSVIS